MSDIIHIPTDILPSSSDENIQKIRMLEEKIREREQIQFRTEHVFHAGMYARTVRIPAGVVFTSVLIKIPTLVITNGCCDIWMGGTWGRFEGYNVIRAAKQRKLVYWTRSDLEVTMLFATNVKTVEEVEAEFTDETENLLSRSNKNDIVSTDTLCQASQPAPLS